MKKILVLTTCAGLMLASCATSPDDPNKHTKQNAAAGAGLGAVAGAIIGYQSGRGSGAVTGALIGGAAGGLLGAGVGQYQDKQEAEFKQKLANEQAAHQVEVERLQNENLKITMNSEVSFDFNSANLKPAFLNTLDKVADILRRYPRSSIQIIGHTDNVGSDAYNQNLSLRRAQAVSNYLQNAGINPGRLQAIGRGESQPRASNDTEAGRQLNRRVEMLIIPDKDIQ